MWNKRQNDARISNLGALIFRVCTVEKLNFDFDQISSQSSFGTFESFPEVSKRGHFLTFLANFLKLEKKYTNWEMIQKYYKKIWVFIKIEPGLFETIFTVQALFYIDRKLRRKVAQKVPPPSLQCCKNAHKFTNLYAFFLWCRSPFYYTTTTIYIQFRSILTITVSS